MIYEFCIIGGGIVGLATALEILRQRPGCSIILLEKEKSLGSHQTGHNSGVIHAGIYYKPGSLKAQLCREGARATKEFCRTHGIPFETRGKLVVATNDTELHQLDQLFDNALQNQIEVERIGGEQLHKLEPNVAGLGAILSPTTGIVDYAQICRVMGQLIENDGGNILYEINVDRIEETANSVTIRAGSQSWASEHVIICAGLQSDRLGRSAGLAKNYQIVPFRGEYYALRAEKKNIVNHLIYPVPDPDLPFLGIHLTPMIDGSLTVGPNAVLGFSREGYDRLSFNLRDISDMLGFPGFWKVIAQNWRSGIGEFHNSLSKQHYLTLCQKYCPSLTLDDLEPYRAGIRAQAVGRDGSLIHDFLIETSSRITSVANAPSPAATSAIPIGAMITKQVIDNPRTS